jgi:hypothetical protein
MYLADSIVAGFVGKVKNHHKTEAIHLYDNKYRINVWTVTKGDLVDHYIIDRSYFISYDDGKIIDKTV